MNNEANLYIITILALLGTISDRKNTIKIFSKEYGI